MLTHVLPRVPLVKLEDITFITSTCLAYLLREELVLSLPEKPLVIVYVLEHRVLSAIFSEKRE